MAEPQLAKLCHNDSCFLHIEESSLQPVDNLLSRAQELSRPTLQLLKKMQDRKKERKNEATDTGVFSWSTAGAPLLAPPFFIAGRRTSHPGPPDSRHGGRFAKRRCCTPGFGGRTRFRATNHGKKGGKRSVSLGKSRISRCDSYSFRSVKPHCLGNLRTPCALRTPRNATQLVQTPSHPTANHLADLRWVESSVETSQHVAARPGNRRLRRPAQLEGILQKAHRLQNVSKHPWHRCSFGPGIIWAQASWGGKVVGLVHHSCPYERGDLIRTILASLAIHLRI